MITDEQLAEYEEHGAVTIDSPFTKRELDRAEAAWDRVKRGGGKIYEEPEYLEVLQHPYFEEVAKKLLRADAVHLWWTVAAHARPPATPPFERYRDQWVRGCHADIQATLEDFDATPRRMRVELWFWLNEVPANRGAMRFLPGSHRAIMEHWGRVLPAEQRAILPRVHGLRPAPVPETYPSFPEGIPELGETPWVECEPTPLAARRGQILVLCSAGLHSAWQNEDTEPRKAMLMPWGAVGVRCGLPKNQCDAARALFNGLRSKLPAERAHIVPDQLDWIRKSDYRPKWPKTFLPA